MAIEPNLVELPVLSGERIRLRPIDADDTPALMTLFGDPQVARFMGIPLIRSEVEARDLLLDIDHGLRTRTLFQWGLTRAGARHLIGTCTLSSISWRNERAEIGCALAPVHWGRGLMREALRVLLDHAFTSLMLHRIEADVDPRNTRSLRLLEGIGFRREGYLPDRHLIAGERQDSVVLGLLSTAWLHSAADASVRPAALNRPQEGPSPVAT